MSFEKAEKMVDGHEMKLGGQALIVPALNLRGLRKVKDQFTALAQADQTDPSASVGPAVAIIQMALARNYPNITSDDIEDLIDMASLPEVIKVVSGQSGLQQEAGDSVGELTGEVSTVG